MRKWVFYGLIIIFHVACRESISTDTKSHFSADTSTELQNLNQFIGQDYLMDDQHSYIGFKIKYFGFSPVRGRFNDFDGTLFYDEQKTALTQAHVCIDVSSINTGNERRDKDLLDEGTWFDAVQFPTINFNSKEVILLEDGGFNLIGHFTIKGITKIDTIAFGPPTKISKDWAGNDQVDFSGRITINRLDYKVFGGDFWSSVMENGLMQLSDKVEIELDLHCRKADYLHRYNTADSTDFNKLVLDEITNKGIDYGVKMIDEASTEGKLTSGKLSSITYTLNALNKHEAALIIAKKRAAYFPEKTTTFNQLGITYLLLGNRVEARNAFKSMIMIDSCNTRALSYLHLMDLLNP